MINQPRTNVLYIMDSGDGDLSPLLNYFGSTSFINLASMAEPPADLSDIDVILTHGIDPLGNASGRVAAFVDEGGRWLHLASATDQDLPDILPARLSPTGLTAEVRVLFQNRQHVLAERLEDAIYLKGNFRFFDFSDDQIETILYADWHYTHKPVLISRKVGKGQIAGTTLTDFNHSQLQQILFRLLRWMGGHAARGPELGIGLLGYAPSVGQLHGCGVQNTPGLELHAACDLSPERQRQAQNDFPEIHIYDHAQHLADDPKIDLVIIATPPVTHASLSLDMMAAGKHVVCEKPLALSKSETEALVEMADRQKVHLSCHQNRRWDTDYLAIKLALAEGRIGDLFYLETFVGGFHHPCGYWHSHMPISGGTAYDWGGHYLDWIVSLIPDRAASVVGTSHKRVWHDVSNMDQERIQIRFEGGQEAEFIHSDIAATPKPKWYLLGTEGAILGAWRNITTYEIDPLLYFHKQDIPPTEMPPKLTLHRRQGSGQIVTSQLAVPTRRHFQFHRNLADHLFWGEPLAAPLEDSVCVVELLEAASRSAARNGQVEVLGA
jgi:predicted dehydrogenase